MSISSSPTGSDGRPEAGIAWAKEIQLTLHKVRHGELLDEPELVPDLLRLLAELEATAAAFQEARKGLPAEA